MTPSRSTSAPARTSARTNADRRANVLGCRRCERLGVEGGDEIVRARIVEGRIGNRVTERGPQLRNVDTAGRGD